MAICFTTEDYNTYGGAAGAHCFEAREPLYHHPCLEKYHLVSSSCQPGREWMVYSLEVWRVDSRHRRRAIEEELPSRRSECLRAEIINDAATIEMMLLSYATSASKVHTSISKTP
jgi:hypothetical protein